MDYLPNLLLWRCMFKKQCLVSKPIIILGSPFYNPMNILPLISSCNQLLRLFTIRTLIPPTLILLTSPCYKYFPAGLIWHHFRLPRLIDKYTHLWRFPRGKRIQIVQWNCHKRNNFSNYVLPISIQFLWNERVNVPN